MGDIWPYGPPKYVTWDEAARSIEGAGVNRNDAAIFAAIGTAESSLDLSVINDTPSTGDYSVGIWQINYYGSLYNSRVAAYGTPKALINSGLDGQAGVAVNLWLSSGFGAWSTYNSGAYKQYLHGAPPSPVKSIGQFPRLPGITTTDSWHGTIHASSIQVRRIARRFYSAAGYIHNITPRS